VQLRALLAANFVALSVAGCASLEGLRALIQPPRFEQAANRPSEIRVLPVQSGRVAGGATVRIWADVTNPNPFGFTPFDLTVSFANVPRLASVIRQAASGGGLSYRLEGTVGIDAGRFGQPTFGPMTLVTGDVRARF
jgi:hypothetical protein